MTYSLDKELSIQYNSLNLPQEMAANNVSARGKSFYIYKNYRCKILTESWSLRNIFKSRLYKSHRSRIGGIKNSEKVSF